MNRVTTAEELDKFPVGTIIRDADEDPLKKGPEGYWHDGGIAVREVPLPAIVLWEPAA